MYLIKQNKNNNTYLTLLNCLRNIQNTHTYCGMRVSKNVEYSYLLPIKSFSLIFDEVLNLQQSKIHVVLGPLSMKKMLFFTGFLGSFTVNKSLPPIPIVKVYKFDFYHHKKRTTDILC